MNTFFLGFQYLRYLLKAKGKHSLHSPFAFNFYNQVIKDSTKYSSFDSIEKLRKQLKKDKTLIEITDFGAGSSIDNSPFRTVAAISKNAEKNPALAQLIYRIIKFQKPSTIIDLGTSLGITTLYESSAYSKAHVFTFEGCPNTAMIAASNFEALSATNISLIIGNIDVELPNVLKNISSLDFVFFDANHRYEPTLAYFNWCVEKAHEDSIFIFDDIYWSPEMKNAWTDIKAHPSVGMTMDLFFLGIVFFRKKQPIQHFTLR